MSTTRHAIHWRTRDISLIRRVCRYLDTPCFMSVNRLTRLARPLTPEQHQTLKPLMDIRAISLLTFTD